MRLIRSLLFNALFMLTIVVFASVVILSVPFPYRWRYHIIILWSMTFVFLLRVTCGLTHRVHGREHLPKGPVVILANHQSTWETVAFQSIFPSLAWVLKRELKWVPVFGWALATMEPIAIDRSAGRQAIDQIIEQGTERLQDGRCVMIFPQGTRVAPGQKRRYGIGGALLAVESGYPVLPVAHNAGRYWPRRGFIKYPGTIDVAIGAPIDTRGRTAEDINSEVQQWIETQLQAFDRKESD